MHLARVFSTSVIFLIGCAQHSGQPGIRFPYEWLGTPGFGGAIDRNEVVEPSGICYHPGRQTLFVVSDEGAVIELETGGSIIRRVEVAGDLEGITVDPSSGLLYIVAEAEDVILEFDPDRMSVVRRFPINRSYKGDPEFLQKQTDEFDNGCEAIAFVPGTSRSSGGTFFVSNQWDPSCIMEVEVPLRHTEGGATEATIRRVLPFNIDDPAAMYYDRRGGYLNVVSDADNILVELTLDGRLVREYAFLGDNQEGITIDESGFLYIAQDSGGILKVRDLRYKTEN